MKRSKLRRYARYYYRQLFPKRQSPVAVATAVFLGVFIGVLPTLGIALPLTALATELFRVPKGPGLVASFIATPPTLFLFFYPLGYVVGVALVHPPPITFDFVGAVGEMSLLHIDTTIAPLWAQAKDHVLAFAVGMTIVAGVTALIAFVATYWIMRHRQLGQQHPQ